ncbi:MAG TPA: chemotaxis protein CheB, partial [Candidatus Berkiella sp.]|nr:chemotaxis protein CheB [Candidatus Berkiella sp.]
TLSSEAINNYVFAIGASTGGIEALKLIFDSLPESMPPIIVIQHLPNGFVDLFVQQINKTSKLLASEAQEGEKLKPSHIYLAKTGLHLVIEQKNNEKFIRYREFSRINGHKPS